MAVKVIDHVVGPGQEACLGREPLLRCGRGRGGWVGAAGGKRGCAERCCGLHRGCVPCQLPADRPPAGRPRCLLPRSLSLSHPNVVATHCACVLRLSPGLAGSGGGAPAGAALARAGSDSAAPGSGSGAELVPLDSVLQPG